MGQACSEKMIAVGQGCSDKMIAKLIYSAKA
jgi:hypothetical protein